MVTFDDMLRARNISHVYEFFTRGRPEGLDVFYIKQSYLCLPRQSIRNNSDRIILFKQTLRDIESMYKDIGGYDVKNEEIKKCVVKLGMKNLNIYVLT